MVKVKTKKYLRIVGYYGSSEDMNKGKVDEFASRRYMLP